jgi:hypothetical protein
VNKTPEERSSAESPKERQIKMSRAAIALLVVTAFVGGFVAAKLSKGEKKLKNDKPIPCTVTPDDKPSHAYESLMKRIDEMKKIKKAVPDWGKNTDVCEMSDDEILDESHEILMERREKEALEFIAKLGITNENDKRGIMDAFLDGCTEVEYINETAISFSDPDNENRYCDNMVNLEEEIKVPEEYKDKEGRQKTEVEKRFEEKIEKEDYFGAIKSINADEIAAELEKEGIDDELFSNQIDVFKKLQELALSGQNPEALRLMACQYFLNLMCAHEAMDDSNQSDAISNNPILNSFFGEGDITINFLQALIALSGLSVDDEDAMKQCMFDALKAQQDCMFDQQ